MTYRIKRIKNKKVILISITLLVILWSIIFFTFISIGYVNAVLITSAIFLCLPISLLIGIRLSQKVLIIKFDHEIIELEDRKIPLQEINGYYINKKSPIMTQIELRTLSNDIELTTVNFGKSGKIFKTFISELLEKTANANCNFLELSYYDFHPTQRKFSRVFIIIVTVLVVVINIVYFYFVLFEGMKGTSKIFLVNLMFLAVYANHQNDKKKAKK
jgi:hypothetical protein